MPGKVIKEISIPASQWAAAVLPLMENGHCFKIPVEGLSMYPLLVGDRDSVVISSISEKRLNRGDIVLFARKDGIHVLHRIYSIKNNTFYMLGDSQTWIEGPIEKENILAIATAVIRKGKTIQLNSRAHRYLATLWMYSRPLRPFLLRVIKQIGRVLSYKFGIAI